MEELIALVEINLVVITGIIIINYAFRDLAMIYTGIGLAIAAILLDLLCLGILISKTEILTLFLAEGFLVYLIGLGIWKKCFIDIPATNPASVGLRIIWGKRQCGKKDIVFEGKHFILNFFPFLLNYFIISEEKRNIDIPDDNKKAPIEVWCKRETKEDDDDDEKGDTIEDDDDEEGGTITRKIAAKMGVRLAYTYTPDINDTKRLIQFIKSGMDQGVQDIFFDVIKERVREKGKDTTWENFLNFEREITNDLSKHFTGEENADDLKNGKSDTKELGILLYRFNVKKIEIIDQELEKAITATPTEKRQRDAEVYEIKTEIKQVEALMKATATAGKKLTFEEAYALIKRYKLIREGKLQGKHISVEGMEGVASAVASAVTAILGKK